MIRIDQLKEEVLRIAAESPEFVYPVSEMEGCSYNPNGIQPACIFGQAFINLGHPVFDRNEGLAIHEVLSAQYGIDSGHGDLVERFSFVQSNQDNGKPWGVAVRFLDESKSLGEIINEWYNNE